MTTLTIRRCDYCGAVPPGDVTWAVVQVEGKPGTKDACPGCMARLVEVKALRAVDRREVG